MLDQIHRMVFSFFLCEFNPNSKKRKTIDVVREVAGKYFSEEKVEEFIDTRLPRFQKALVEEFNFRYTNQSPLRFQIADVTGVGALVQGYGKWKSGKEIAFQNALHGIDPKEFEKLGAIMLRILGCQQAFFTPASHDQGVDAFGYQALLPPMPYGISHSVVWIAQTKHYLASSVSTGDLRELVGTKELLAAKAFSTVDERYKELSLKCYAPIALALITTEEIPSTLRRLAEAAGVFVLAASDLFHILSPRLRRRTAAGLRGLIKKEGKSIPTLT